MQWTVNRKRLRSMSRWEVNVSSQPGASYLAAQEIFGSLSFDQAGHDFKRVAACRMGVHVASQQ